MCEDNGELLVKTTSCRKESDTSEHVLREIRCRTTDSDNILSFVSLIIKNKDLKHIELCSMLCGRLDGRRVGGEWIHVYVWLNPFAAHLKLLHYCL